uniref:Immunoglobulin V-set domain-containing protein n=1 Tax=Cricetulus griseus TaxID=10029 RepID=A0A8C2LV37_CRIGR
MAWEATYLLSAILLVFLASGSWAQVTAVLQTVEGQTIFVKCKYDPSQHFKEKIWCQQTPEETCKILVSSLGRDAQRPGYFIQDHPVSNFFTVTMTALRMRDSGLYYCGIRESHQANIILRSFHLVMSKGCSYPALLFPWSVDSSVRPWSSRSCLLSHRGHLEDRP